MRLILTICLLNLYVFSQTELHQLARLPLLVEHFLEHRQENPTISFWSFLDMHYQHGSPVDQDYAKDQQLPFKSAECHMPLIPALLPLPVFAHLTWEPVAHPNKELIHAEPICSRTQNAIWQPPRHIA